jgi:small subunit ribosomal protein S2
MSDNSEVIHNNLNSNTASNTENNEKNELIESENNEKNELIESENNVNSPSNDNDNYLEEKEDEDNGIDSSDAENLEKMILSTGIRVGTPVKTKSMSRYIVRANPEGRR